MIFPCSRWSRETAEAAWMQAARRSTGRPSQNMTVAIGKHQLKALRDQPASRTSALAEAACLAAVVVLFCLLAGCTPPGRRISPPPPKPKEVGVDHTVQLGETLSSIAILYEVPLNKIESANKISDPNSISIGQKIFIPGATELRQNVLQLVKKPNELKKVSTSEKPPEVKGELYFVCPMAGTVIRKFGADTEVGESNGMDIVSPGGGSVVAAKTGTVYDTPTIGGWGKVIIIDHGSDEQTLYAHMDSVLVEPGDVVKQGQLIGKVGTSGRVSRPTLHFRIYRNGRPIDPNGRFSH